MSSTDFNLYISVHCTCSTTNHTFKTCNVRSLRSRNSPTSNIAGHQLGGPPAEKVDFPPETLEQP